MKKLVQLIFLIITLVLLAGIIKFNFINDDVYTKNEKGEYVNAYGKTVEFENELDRNNDLCDEDGNRYETAEEAQKAGLKAAEYGATYCPEYKMDPSWDINHDGINDCYDDNTCDKNKDYMSPRK